MMLRVFIFCVVALLCRPATTISQETAATIVSSAKSNSSRPLVESVSAIGFTVSDIERSVAFFRDVLSFEMVSGNSPGDLPLDDQNGSKGDTLRQARMKLGDETVVLTEFLKSKGRPIPADSRSNDRWFQHIAIITSDMDRAYQKLLDHKVVGISPAPQRLPDSNPSAGGIRAYYFRDPDGHPLEILQFPADKGRPQWHRATDRLFLGIDHTAIVVADTAASLRFYRDRLGMMIAGESLNFGPEQERLNSVPGARLRITSLRAKSGPGVELLEYLSPSNGRPAKNTQLNDLAYVETIVKLAGATRTSIIFDPDHHAVRLAP